MTIQYDIPQVYDRGTFKRRVPDNEDGSDFLDRVDSPIVLDNGLQLAQASAAMQPAGKADLIFSTAMPSSAWCCKAKKSSKANAFPFSMSLIGFTSQPRMGKR